VDTIVVSAARTSNKRSDVSAGGDAKSNFIRWPTLDKQEALQDSLKGPPVSAMNDVISM